MPFVPQPNRKDMANGQPPKTVGDQCYLAYLPMIQAWKKERRWTTAHNLFKQTFDVDDEQAARTLAYLVFFVKEVMPYEEEKIQENGDI